MYLLGLTVGLTAMVHKARAVTLQCCIDDLERHNAKSSISDNQRISCNNLQIFMSTAFPPPPPWMYLPRYSLEPWNSSGCSCYVHILLLLFWTLCGPTLPRSILAQRYFYDRIKTHTCQDHPDIHSAAQLSTLALQAKSLRRQVLCRTEPPALLFGEDDFKVGVLLHLKASIWAIVSIQAPWWAMVKQIIVLSFLEQRIRILRIS